MLNLTNSGRKALVSGYVCEHGSVSEEVQRPLYVPPRFHRRSGEKFLGGSTAQLAGCDRGL